MRVFIVHNDVPYEFGEVWGVFETRDAAEEYVKLFDDDRRLFLTIEEWETEGNVKL